MSRGRGKNAPAVAGGSERKEELMGTVIPRQEGPTVIPYGPGTPNRPADYGRYLPVDLDENNRYAIEAWCEAHPRQPRPTFGWSICRGGFGRQADCDGMTEAEANAEAIKRNRL